ncbi:hypothetical protein NEOLEDRAFT_238723 [Neolentinus lepideus HHB14362 ss-1]|uniref:F-box domain-containing protein n=1 Tax=Neolentinus lepideus HHB14362 ss-1 TaxID=1314782 RepID=A0A165M9J7_9AGAM|nr:hypothetical protein NEOLEDRAFT_238723 [Neolentinus lepideus HHB14362 ss-1]
MHVLGRALLGPVLPSPLAGAATDGRSFVPIYWSWNYDDLYYANQTEGRFHPNLISICPFSFPSTAYVLCELSSPTLMDTLPLELIEHIFSDACCDAGQTACSLRLLCRSSHALVEPLRFRSVAVSSYGQMDRFLQTYKPMARSATSGSAIFHLFMIVKADAGIVDTEKLAEDIIRLAAPTLKTLTCYLHNGKVASIYECLLTIQFPQLSHLTFNHPERPTYSLIPKWLPARPACLYPNLEYLRVSFAWGPSLVEAHQEASLFTARACSSKLTHICVSGASLEGRRDFASLRTILQLTPKESWDGAQAIEPLPPTVTQYTLGVNAEKVRVEAAERGKTALGLTTYESGETWEEEKQVWIRSRSNDAEDDAECSKNNAARLEAWMTVFKSCYEARKLGMLYLIGSMM